MRIWEKLEATARDRMPFSNSTMGEIWMSRWCYAGCVHEPECPLLLLALMDQTPAEWRELPDTQDQYHCVEYRRTL